jgi:hypothetical protein
MFFSEYYEPIYGWAKVNSFGHCVTCALLLEGNNTSWCKVYSRWWGTSAKSIGRSMAQNLAYLQLWNSLFVCHTIYQYCCPCSLNQPLTPTNIIHCQVLWIGDLEHSTLENKKVKGEHNIPHQLTVNNL